MKNAKIVKIAPTTAASALAMKIICAQKFASVECANQRKPKAKKAAAAVGDAVMGAAVESGKKAATKVENYSAEVTEKLLAAWGQTDKSKEAVAKLAQEFGKTARSIVAKLSREKVYVKQEYVTKAGTAPVSKEELVTTIEAFCGVPAGKLESLEKANKGVLQILLDVLTKTAHDHDNTAADRETEEAVAAVEMKAQREADEAQADKDIETYSAS